MAKGDLSWNPNPPDLAEPPCDAERHELHSHAEHGNDSQPSNFLGSVHWSVGTTVNWHQRTDVFSSSGIFLKYVDSNAPEILCQTLNSALGTAASGEK